MCESIFWVILCSSRMRIEKKFWVLSEIHLLIDDARRSFEQFSFGVNLWTMNHPLPEPFAFLPSLLDCFVLYLLGRAKMFDIFCVIWSWNMHFVLSILVCVKLLHMKEKKFSWLLWLFWLSNPCWRKRGFLTCIVPIDQIVLSTISIV